MTVFQIVTRRQYRGAEVFAANLSKELIKHNIKIIFVGLYKAPEEVLTVESAVNIDLNGKPGFFSFGLLSRLKAIVKQYKPDVIQANGSDTLKYAAALKISHPKIPVIYRNISIISKWIGNSWLKKKYYTYIFSKVDHVTSVGNEAIADLIKCVSYPAHRTTVIRRGIPIQNINKMQAAEKIRAEFNLLPSDLLLVHAGNFSPEKNHIFLLNLFEGLKEDPRLKLILVGEGYYKPHIESEIISKGLNNTVFLTGFRKDVQQVIAGCDLFVLCSLVEGVPGVILEAAAQKVPTLAVSVGGVKEVIDHNISGILLNNYDVNEWKKTIFEIMNNTQLLHRMGNSAFEKVRTEFSPSQHVETFIYLYNKLSSDIN